MYNIYYSAYNNIQPGHTTNIYTGENAQRPSSCKNVVPAEHYDGIAGKMGIVGEPAVQGTL